MQNFCVMLGSKQVFGMIAECSEETKQLEVLVREVEVICKMSKKTGLWIVADLLVNNRKVVITSLREKVILTDCDQKVLHEEISKH